MKKTAPRLYLKEERETPFLYGHPWVFSGAVARLEGDPRNGDEAALYASTGEFIAWGLFNRNSQILLRLYSWQEDTPVSDSLFSDRIRAAVRLRRETLGLLKPGKACRLVFSEGDGLSGLVADLYDDILVVQFTSLAMAKRMETLVACLEEEVKPKAVYLRTEKGIKELEGLVIEDGLLRGNPESQTVTITENGLDYEVNFNTGHKTGFYLDQRDNRARAALFAPGKKCLDLFCYSGGFSLNLARAGAKEVTGIDTSAPALDLAKKNAERNKISNVSFMREDAEKAMTTFLSQQSGFDLIVLDPPRFAQSGPGVRQAIKGYTSLNVLAAQLLAPGGILVTCSCSGRVVREDFRGMLSAVSHQSGRSIRVLEQRGAAPDHPVAVSCPESDYLKCFICSVE